MYKIILYFFYALFFLNTISGYAKTLKLATWNLEWLVSQEDIKKYPVPNDVLLRKNQDFKLLSEYAKALNADIIALQEIGSIQTLYSVFPQQKYFFLMTHDQIAQHTAIIIKKSAIDHIAQNPDITDLNLYANSPHLLRSGLDITLSINHQNIRLLIVHLKSGCQDYPLNTPHLKKSCLIIKRQNPILQKWIQNRINEQQSFIIIGDFNRIISPNDPFFKNLSSQESGLIIPTAYKANPCWDGNYFIDGFLLDKIISKNLIQNSLKVLTYKKQDNDKRPMLSDHCPVSIQLTFPDESDKANTSH